jgi:hypothetical protein
VRVCDHYTEDDGEGGRDGFDCGGGGDCTLRQALRDANGEDRDVFTRIVFARGVVGGGCGGLFYTHVFEFSYCECQIK